MEEENIRMIEILDDNKKEVNHIMKKIQITSWMFLGFVTMAALLLSMVLTPIQAEAVVCPASPTGSTVDSDMDGFYDDEECFGFVSPLGVPVVGSNGTCNAGDICLDPNVQNLVVILTPAPTNSKIPENPLAHVSKPRSEGGLGIIVSIINSAKNCTDMLDDDGDGLVDDADPDCNRIVTNRTNGTFQKAVRITEDNTTPLVDPDNDEMGRAQYGTPNGIDKATIFTKRIYDMIDTYCAGDTGCKDTVSNATITSSPSLYDVYIRNTFAHEVGHMLNLTNDYTTRFGGFHERAGSGIIMQQYNKFNSNKNTFTVPDSFSGANQTATNLIY